MDGYPAIVLIENLYEAAHVGTFVSSGQIHVHIDLCDGLLLAHVLVTNRDGIPDTLDPYLIDVYVSIIFMVLDVLHGLPHL